MKAWLLLLLCNVAWAAPVSLDFDGVPLPQLARVVVQDLGGLGYAFTPAFEEVTKRVSLHLDKVDKGVALDALVRLVESEGFAVERGPVFWIDKPTKEGDLVYRPRYRSASYLVDVAGPLFRQGVLSVQAQGQGAPGGVAVVSGGAATPSSSSASGSSAATQAGSGSGILGVMQKLDVVAYRGLLRDVERLKAFLAQVDTEQPELLIKAVVFEVSKARGESSALSLASSLLHSKLNISMGNVAPGDWSAVFKSASVSAVFAALSSDSRFKVISQPQLRVTSGGSAKLTVGTLTPVIGGTQVTSNGNTIQSVDYKPSGVILELRPEVRGDVASLQIDQQVSEFQQTTTGVDQSPTLSTREVQTSVAMRGDDVLVLGGLVQDKSNSADSGPPWLPVFLHARSSTSENTEILMFLQAQRL